METNGVLTVKDAAVRKGVSLTAVYDAIRADRLPSVTLLGRMGVRREDLDAWVLNSGGAQPGAGRPPKRNAEDNSKR